ncbi:protein phosphatase 1 regulatory subunit 37 [Boleophthalmus pectinirostris]|uniref:protein phosphatase 1 regulatory subunit 37 n=1 Tax=Boleophthalmus pectinirostris TaxID=150288 RepID=UPI00242C8C08|nr:protein phosphatase 1 regulatory subunit 37 [Boleophthalmus pectinirostris]XP_055004028.1 protein phosphatase 1 regulatory subunit 37 [Boleophthalmus pectinirostris]XP_055004029.1 protein phosphatase 1 regulatory subunit 37 [Boleophthalmus pectinirostris]
MNIEEQCLDVCNIKTKVNDQDDDNTTTNSEGVIPCISELMMDINSDKQTIVPTDTTKLYLMPQLTDNVQATEEDNQKDPDGQEIDEVNGNCKSSTQNTHVVENPSNIVISNEEPLMDSVGVTVKKEEKDCEVISGESREAGDMDIGLDLSLNESGVLESESSDVTQSNNALASELSTQEVLALSTTESVSDESQNRSTEPTSTEQTEESPAVEEAEDKLKTGGKRVTFPSDEDIVSGAVEPKDPWRHGNFCL